MDKGKKSFWLQNVREMNKWAGISFAGLALYIALSAFEWYLPADLIAVVFAGVACWTFFSVLDGRKRDKEAVSYSLMWGTGAVAVFLVAVAALGVKQRLGL